MLSLDQHLENDIKLKNFNDILDNFLKRNYRWIYTNDNLYCFEKKFDELREKMNIEFFSSHIVYFKLMEKYNKKFLSEVEQELQDSPAMNFIKKILGIY